MSESTWLKFPRVHQPPVGGSEKRMGHNSAVTATPHHQTPQPRRYLLRTPCDSVLRLVASNGARHEALPVAVTKPVARGLADGR